MLLSFAYLAFSALLRLLVGAGAASSPRTSNCSFCGISSLCSVGSSHGLSVRAADRAFLAALTRMLPSARRRRVDRDAADAAALAPRAGTAQVDAADRRPAAVRRLSVAYASSCCAWRGRIRAGATRGSPASC